MPWLRLECLAIIVASVYLNGFDVPFLLDDTAISESSTLRQWTNIAGLFHPPANGTLSGRPVANISFAMNYAITGPSLVGLHLGNLLVHLAAALTLMGLVGRVLCLPYFQGRYRQAAPWIGFFVATLWAVNPANVTAVTYLVQRTEALVGLFYLLTLYCFVRSHASSRPRLWWSLAAMACLLGMGTKEVMVSAPVAVLLFDRVFLADSWRSVIRQRWHVHAALFATLAWLLYLAAGDPRGASAGLDSGVTWWQYLIIQATWWPRYAIGSLWPAWLCFDHGPVVQSQPLVTWGQFFPRVFVPLIIAMAGLIALCVRRPAAGWVMLTAAMVLAPSSSVVPIATEVLADHRGYLPRAAVIALVVVWVHGLSQARWSRSLAVGVWIAWVVGFSAMTVRYNELLRDPVALWRDVVRQYPLNARASNNLGQALIDYRGDEQHLREAIIVLHCAQSLSPGDARVLNNLALAHARFGESDAAIAIYSDALAIDPRNATVLNNRGALYRDLGRDDDAMADFAAALQAEPSHRRATYNRAMLLLDRGETAAAEADLRALTHAWPDYAHSHYGLGRVAESRGDWPAAIEAYQRALQLNPHFAEARDHLENCLAQQRGDGD